MTLVLNIVFCAVVAFCFLCMLSGLKVYAAYKESADAEAAIKRHRAAVCWMVGDFLMIITLFIRVLAG